MDYEEKLIRADLVSKGCDLKDFEVYKAYRKVIAKRMGFVNLMVFLGGFGTGVVVAAVLLII